MTNRFYYIRQLIIIFLLSCGIFGLTKGICNDPHTYSYERHYEYDVKRPGTLKIKTKKRNAVYDIYSMDRETLLYEIKTEGKKKIEIPSGNYILKEKNSNDTRKYLIVIDPFGHTTFKDTL